MPDSIKKSEKIKSKLKFMTPEERHAKSVIRAKWFAEQIGKTIFASKTHNERTDKLLLKLYNNGSLVKDLASAEYLQEIEESWDTTFFSTIEERNTYDTGRQDPRLFRLEYSEHQNQFHHLYKRDEQNVHPGTAGYVTIAESISDKTYHAFEAFLNRNYPVGFNHTTDYVKLAYSEFAGFLKNLSEYKLSIN